MVKKVLKVLKNSPTVKCKFLCELCDYKCSRKSELIRHKDTKKHKKAREIHKKARKKKQNVEFMCNYCGKKYSHQSAISRHMNNCKLNDGTIVEKYIKLTKSVKKNPFIQKTHEEDLEKDMEIKDLKIHQKAWWKPPV